MPRMKGAAVQCCMCITGVFMFLGGVVMLATGITLILNYGFFDEDLLPPDLQNEKGKKTVGIILTCCGVFAIVVSVIVSVLYFCAQSKSPTINPHDLHRIPNTARNNTPDSLSRRSDRTDRRISTGTKINPVPNGTARTHHVKQIPGSAEVKLPRAYKKGRHRKNARHVRRLEEIKEQDAISRKTVDGALINEGFENDTPRSGSFSSEMTLDDQSRIPKVVLNEFDNSPPDDYENRPSVDYGSRSSIDYGSRISVDNENGDSKQTDNENRPQSASSMTASLTSDISSDRYLENNKYKREMQSLQDSVRYKDLIETMSKDSGSLDRYGESSVNDTKFADECSLTSDNLRNFGLSSNTPSQNSDNVGMNSAGGISSDRGYDAGPAYLPEVPDSDESIISYKASHHTELHGEQTSGRISPQIGEVEMFTSVEIQKENSGLR